ncbi:MAG: T9SS type A sorting domain-containing protein, partial [Bacteroidota bacterium]
TVNVTIPAGMTYAFYITNDFGAGTSYTDGTAVGNFLAADANITVFEGVGKSYPFGLTFNVRNFNGHIFYDFGGALDIETPTLTADALDNEIMLSWEPIANPEEQTYELLSSTDGRNFSPLTEMKPGAVHYRYSDTDAAPNVRYQYKVRVRDFSGEFADSPIVEASLWNEQEFEVGKPFPNPFDDNINFDLNLRQDQTVDIRILDLRGKVLHAEQQLLAKGQHRMQPDMGALSAGIYLLQVLAGGQQQTLRIVHR